MPEPELVIDLSALAGRWNRHADLEALVRAVPQVKQGGCAFVGPFHIQRSANLVEVMPHVPNSPRASVCGRRQTKGGNEMKKPYTKNKKKTKGDEWTTSGVGLPRAATVRPKKETQLESLWSRKQIHDPTGSEWHANGKLLYTKDNDFIGEMEHSDDARFVCDAVNNAPLFDILLDDNKELMRDVDRLRAELSDKARNYEDVISHHQRTEEYLRGLIKRLITVREKVFWRKDEKTGMTYESCLMDEDEARKTIEEAKAAIKEDVE